MEDEHLKSEARSLKRWLTLAVTASVAAGFGFVLGHRAWTEIRADSIPFNVLKTSVPVLLQIQFTGKSTDVAEWTSGEPFREAKGVTRYTFTNWTSAPVQLAFPPARSFHLTRGSMSADESPPSFASKPFVLRLAAGESKSFSEPYSVAPVDEEFWRGGPGFRAFVFDAPSTDSKAGYCVGTVFGQYTTTKESP